MSDEFEKYIDSFVKGIFTDDEKGDLKECWTASRQSIKEKGPVYRVKPLEGGWKNWLWRHDLETSIGQYSVQFGESWSWRLQGVTKWKECESLDEAKAYCQAHYRESVLKSLEEVIL